MRALWTYRPESDEPTSELRPLQVEVTGRPGWDHGLEQDSVDTSVRAAETKEDSEIKVASDQ